MRALRTTILASCLTLSFLASAGDASAQTDEERSGARSAASEGLKAYKVKDYANALDMFSRAEKLIHAPTHLLFIARSAEKLGKLVKAREAYLKLAREDVSKGPGAFKKAKADAKAELEKLEGRIPYVSVVVQGAGASNVRVTMDGARVPDALVGVPRPVDPGKHEFQAFAEGMKSSPRTVTIPEGAKDTVVLTLQEDANAAAAAPAAAAATTSDVPPDEPPPGGDEPKAGGSNDGMRYAAYGALGVGVLGLGLGTVFLLKKGSKQDEADDLVDDCAEIAGQLICPPGQEAEVTALDDEASSAGTISNIGFGVGALGVIGGVVLLFMSMDSGDSESAANSSGPSITPWMGYKSAGVFGRF